MIDILPPELPTAADWARARHRLLAIYVQLLGGDEKLARAWIRESMVQLMARTEPESTDSPPLSDDEALAKFAELFFSLQLMLSKPGTTITRLIFDLRPV